MPGATRKPRNVPSIPCVCIDCHGTFMSARSTTLRCPSDRREFNRTRARERQREIAAKKRGQPKREDPKIVMDRPGSRFCFAQLQAMNPEKIIRNWHKLFV